MTKSSVYDRQFFAATSARVLQSARIVVPLVVGILKPQSVVDVGCGVGVWLAVFKENGVERILGLDGNYVDVSSLYIAKECFRAVDLSRPFQVQDEFDLAVCLEVAEHLPKASAAGLVRSLAKLAPVIMFSAGIPLQEGTNHINLQWPEYWAELFHEYNYVRLDVIRKLIWKDAKIAWWYRQNMFLFVRNDLVASRPEFVQAAEEADDLILMHRSVWEELAWTGSIVRRLPRMIGEVLSRRVRSLVGLQR